MTDSIVAQNEKFAEDLPHVSTRLGRRPRTLPSEPNTTPHKNGMPR